MEPVPETERMEEFRPSPLPTLPTLRLQSPPPILALSADADSPRKPPTIRRSTEPPSPSSPSWVMPAGLPYRPRTTSPLSGFHTRSRSAASSLGPPMIRTQSLPGVSASGHILYSPQLRSQSPTASPNRVRPPSRKVFDDVFPTSPTRMSVLDHERPPLERSSSSTGTITTTSTLARRRPSSPLRHVASSSTSSLPAGIPSTPSSSSVTSSPSYRPYDSFPSASMPSSSVPSTPTSTRSRSPSISSLETIPDSPDAEEAALEAERIAQLKADADAADGNGAGSGGESKGGRSSLDVPARGRTLGFGARDKRKRWSVCGAERRGDLDLETIWED